MQEQNSWGKGGGEILHSDEKLVIFWAICWLLGYLSGKSWCLLATMCAVVDEAPGGGAYQSFGILERDSLERGHITNSRQKFHANVLLQSLCIVSFEKSLLATSIIHSY